MSDDPGFVMQITLKRIISVATLLTSLIVLVLLLKKPAPVGHPQAPAVITQNALSFDQKMVAFEQATSASASAGVDATGPKAEMHVNSDEVSAVLAQSLGSGGPQLSPTSDVGTAAPVLKDQRVSFEGDVVHGQFLTQIAGKDIWITISGHLGEKDGYATFDPTEFKVGDLSVPVSLVNPALQKKLSEERDRLKLPGNVGNLKIENSELVMQQR